MTLSEATRLYQASLEELRASPDDEELELQVLRAERQMNASWLEHTILGGK